MSDRDRTIGARLLDFCVGVLLAAMALYGAVQLIRSIWLALCLIVLAALLLVGGAWYAVMRNRRF